MKFRYREMVYRPDFYEFRIDDREEWFPNGIFTYNVSRLIKDLAADDNEKDLKTPWLNKAVRIKVPVAETIRQCHGLGRLEEAHIKAADLERPLIFIELAPDSFNLIDGRHRLEKARREGIIELPAWMVDAHAAVRYLGSEQEYSRYVEYWNYKIEDLGDEVAYSGRFCLVPAPQQERDLDRRHIWNRLSLCLNECRRVEMYSEGQWFTLFRLAGKIYCGEAEAHRPSIRCQSPFQVTFEMLDRAARYFEELHDCARLSDALRARRKEIRKIIRRADVLMACIRIFSEY